MKKINYKQNMSLSLDRFENPYTIYNIKYIHDTKKEKKNWEEMKKIAFT